MPRDRNFLLGYGERLTEKHERVQAGGEKRPPYAFPRAVRRAQALLNEVNAALQALPEAACPGGEVVAALTMHPRYISKSDLPRELLKEVGLRVVGSKPIRVAPERWGIQKPPKGPALAEQLFVAGTKASFLRWERTLPTWTPQHHGAEDLQHVESLASFRATDKVKGLGTTVPTAGRATLEVVLHADAATDVLGAFNAYASQFQAEVLVRRAKRIGGLIFLPVRALTQIVPRLAEFSFLRVARGMPQLRPIASVVRSASQPVVLPRDGPLNAQLRVAVFDGGLPASMDFAPWVRSFDADGVGPAVKAYQDHGAAVTSALLFGPLGEGAPATVPFAGVDHYRVLDTSSGAGDLEILDVLDRILPVLDRKPTPYEFVNLSLGPRLPAEDDDVTRWTAEFDQRLAGGSVLASVAAGNDGELDAVAGLNRIQPPSDGINVLSVGSCDSRAADSWSRAKYSCVGPGRNPGFVKPDGVAFGGSEAEPFRVVIDKSGGSVGVTGTSFAAPAALRTAVGVRTKLGEGLRPLALRALLIHRSHRSSAPMAEVGWGRFEPDVDLLLTCDDDEVLVVYQDELPKGYYLRAPVPLPKGLTGMVHLTATVLIAPRVSPESADAYTRGGLDIVWRPNRQRFNSGKDGKITKHPASRPFFGCKSIFGQGEYQLREAGKWEPCRRAEHRLQARSLVSPAFDLYHHSRDEADDVPVPYALVIGIRAPRVADLYNQVVRAYSNVLIPLRPQVQVQVRT